MIFHKAKNAWNEVQNDDQVCGIFDESMNKQSGTESNKYAKWTKQMKNSTIFVQSFDKRTTPKVCSLFSSQFYFLFSCWTNNNVNSITVNWVKETILLKLIVIFLFTHTSAFTEYNRLIHSQCWRLFIISDVIFVVCLFIFDQSTWTLWSIRSWIMMMMILY